MSELRYGVPDGQIVVVELTSVDEAVASPDGCGYDCRVIVRRASAQTKDGDSGPTAAQHHARSDGDA